MFASIQNDDRLLLHFAVSLQASCKSKSNLRSTLALLLSLKKTNFSQHKTINVAVVVRVA